MKLMAVILFSLLSLSAFADCNREVQFIGKVTNVQVQPAAFSFQLKLGRWFVPSMVCPMFEDEFEAAVIELAGTPAIAEGDEISGVLVFDQKSKSYRIE